MLFLHEKLPTMHAVGEWREPLFRAMAIVCNCSAATLKAIVVVSRCNEILLSITLAFTHSLAFYLSTMLRLNALLRLTLAGVLSSHEELLDRPSTNCSTWPSSQTSRHSSCSPLCCGGGGSVRWSKSALRAVPALCRCSLSVCIAVLTLTHVALSALLSLWSDFRPSVSTIRTLCGCIRPLLSTLQTVTGYSTKVLGIVWDMSSLISSPWLCPVPELFVYNVQKTNQKL